MALVVHYLCSSSTIPLARAVRSRALTIKSSSIVKTPDSHVLLGMSEPDLQQLALNFGQVSITLCFIAKVNFLSLLGFKYTYFQSSIQGLTVSTLLTNVINC